MSGTVEWEIGVIAIAAFLDYTIGDPQGWLHPVQVMGWGITGYSNWVWQWIKSPVLLRSAGVVLAIGLIGGSGGLAWGMVAIGRSIHPLLGAAIASILLASCFAGRSLRAAAEDVLQPVSVGDLAEAQTRLSRYVGRDTDRLSESEILRAVLETVTENAVDGVMAPLFYALIGGLLGTVWSGTVWPGMSVALAVAYKAASTLDSMIGYRTPPYADLGWFSAKFEDVLTWLPCRLTVVTLALISGKPGYVWRICQRDAPQDPSPNSGWSECSYAAVLGVQVGGKNWYGGVEKFKPLLGEPLREITTDRIYQALRLTRWCFLGWCLLALLGKGIIWIA